MRLLYTTSGGRLRFTEDLIGDNIPPYAILSHTWKEGQEVTFDNLKELGSMEDIDAQSKEGYRKIRFCSSQAKLHGLDYFWVDTCCIDKSNSSELQEAINSMFGWYQKAKRCYVYLSDVKKGPSDCAGESSWDWEQAFKDSRWFTRGWTLQELLAPGLVEFFSSDGLRLGDKNSLKHIIHQITQIPVEALAGSVLSAFSVTERFSWIDNRRTTREEDGAYCLLGIFGIHMPLIYGEGRENAYKRLHKKVKDLGRVPSWLIAPDPSTNLHSAIKQRQAETGLWLLESANFEAWKQNSASRLWLYGIPGCGKTILSSALIEHLLHCCHADIRSATAYFYFDFSDAQKQDPELMLRSLIAQLLPRLLTVPGTLDALITSCSNGQQEPAPHVLLEMLRQTIQGIPQVYVVLDALDECSQRLELLEMLTTVTGWQLQNLHILLTSRKERDIEDSLASYIDDENALCLQSDVVDKDIHRYIEQRLSCDQSLAKWRKDATVKQEIEFALTNGARGMFRWAVCQLDMLSKCRNRAMLRNSLATMPPTLDQTYDRILCAISDQDSQYAMRILQWLTYSARPLSIGEIAEIVAVDGTRDPAFDRDEILVDPLEALNICSSLVTITTDTKTGKRQIIALAHYSVQEYLVSNRIRQGPAKKYGIEESSSHAAISRSCLKYFLQLQQLDPPSNVDLRMPALVEYSARYWDNHLLKSGDSTGELSELAVRLLSIDNPAYFTWAKLRNEHFNFEWQSLEITSPLYCAASLGLIIVVQLLLEAGADVKDDDRRWESPLHAAAAENHEQVVKILLDAGANIEHNCGFSGTPLYAASAWGNERIVKMLLDRGANPDNTDRNGATPLYCASSVGNVESVRLLLDRGANLDITNRYGETSLHKASSIGNVEIVRLLLDRGANPDVTRRGGRTPLHDASSHGNIKVVRLLLDRGANLDITDSFGETPLNDASSAGDAEIVGLLLDRGANLDTTNTDGETPLHNASSYGSIKVARLLLDRGANPDITNTDGETPVHNASSYGNIEVVRLLLDRGATLDMTNRHNWTPLHIASRNGNVQLVELLLDRGANLDIASTDRWTPLHIASDNGNVHLVELLLGRGANLDIATIDGWTPLNSASNNGNIQAVGVLLDHDADHTVANRWGRTPLHSACAEGYLEVVRLLLEKGAWEAVNGLVPIYGTIANMLAFRGYTDILRFVVEHNKANLRQVDSHDRNPLMYSVRGGHPETYQYLMECGLELTQSLPRGESLINLAASSGSLEMISTILKQDCVPAPAPGYWGPLHWACRTGQAKVVEFLLAQGWQSESPALPSKQHAKKLPSSWDVQVYHPWHFPRGSYRDLWAKPLIRSLFDSVSDLSDIWTPLAIAIFHRNEDMLQGLSESSRAALGVSDSESDAVYQQAALQSNVLCDGCFHDIYGPRFRCHTCGDFDYCFMCRPFMQHLHPNHEWERIEAVSSEINLENGSRIVET